MQNMIRFIRRQKTTTRVHAMTLAELADKVGISAGALSDIEKGKPTTTRTLERIAQALDVGVNDLLVKTERQPCDGARSRSAKTSAARRRGKGVATTTSRRAAGEEPAA